MIKMKIDKPYIKILSATLIASVLIIMSVFFLMPHNNDKENFYGDWELNSILFNDMEMYNEDLGQVWTFYENKTVKMIMSEEDIDEKIIWASWEIDNNKKTIEISIDNATSNDPNVTIIPPSLLEMKYTFENNDILKLTMDDEIIIIFSFNRI